jgi:hypothetical protein
MAMACSFFVITASLGDSIQERAEPKGPLVSKRGDWLLFCIAKSCLSPFPKK